MWGMSIAILVPCIIVIIVQIEIIYQSVYRISAAIYKYLSNESVLLYVLVSNMSGR